MASHGRLGMGLALLLADPGLALEPASGAAIRAAIPGNTIQGDMAASGAYTEFYALDGTIRAQDYQGTWRIDGDRMCFRYGPEPETCWQVALSGDQITWLTAGKTDGTGTILPGNPHEF
jgi:hypothetical protein